MLKTKLIFLLLFCSTILSCKREVSDEIRIDSLGIKIIQDISGIPQLTDKNLAYSNLSDNERYLYWDAKFGKMIDNYSLTDKQTELLQEFKKYLSVKLFEDGDAKAIFKAIWLPKWLARAKKVFSPDEIYYSVFTIEYRDASNTDAVLLTEPSEKRCHCAVGSSYTCFGQIPVYPYVGFNECMKLNECLEASRGCGALGDDKCNGDFCISTVS